MEVIMAEEVKFTEEEMNKVKEFQNKYFEIQSNFGQVHIARLRLEEQLISLDKSTNDIQEQFKKTTEEEKEFLNKITEKYGDGSLNPDTSVFTPNKS
jgi:septal ring factor EnvC (AmiA/AmiB activator)|tara:strand:+ start:117 stop:407 length:291 start_codon:yes stop_codon:yes gene_type:complete